MSIIKPKLNNLITHLILVYMFLPFTIFILGWVKLVLAIPVIIILIYCYFKMAKSFPQISFLDNSRNELIRLAFIFLIILLWVYLSGIGGFVFQNPDHLIRNGMFATLVAEKWPIYYLNPPIDSFEQPVALVYYFGFWLPSALVGKIFGLTVGFFTQLLWAALGIFLFYCLIIEKFVKRIIIWPLIIFIFFSGLDIVGYYFLLPGETIGATSHLEDWASLFQFSSITTQLFWVFNQSIPAWIATMLIIMQKNNRFIVVILALTMINSTFPFVGLTVLSLFVIINNLLIESKLDTKNKITNSLRNLFTPENVVGGGVIGIISFLFLNENISNTNFRLLEFNSLKGTLLVYILFIILEAMVFIFAICKYQRNNYLIYYSAIWLAICPWVFVGSFYNFSMRASIPALVVLYCLVIDTLKKSYGKKDFRAIIIIMILLLLGSSTSIREFRRTTANTIDRARNNIPIALENRDLLTSPAKEELFGYIDNSMFFNYVSKIPDR